MTGVGETDTAEGSGNRKPVKSETAFRTISEVSDDLEVPQHVLRFWESKFPQIKPLKRGGGRRYYRPEDLQLLKRIRDLLYQDGYTIRGVQKLLRDQSRGHAGTTGGRIKEEDTLDPHPAGDPEPAADGEPAQHAGADDADMDTTDGTIHVSRDDLVALLDELNELRSLLRQGRGQ